MRQHRAADGVGTDGPAVTGAAGESGEAGEVGEADPLRLRDPWYDELASGWGESPPGESPTGPAAQPRSEGPAAPGREDRARSAAPRPDGSGGAPPQPPSGRPAARPVYDEQAAVYLAVQQSPAFQEVRRSHRQFVFPATVAFLLWYLLYIVTATAAPGLMSRPLGAGPFNVGMLAGIGQFLSTALLTWAYVRHARLRRDRAAFELRWDTQLRTRRAGR